MRAMDCSLTTSIDCPMCTVLGMLPRVPLTNSATSCTVNICNSSSKIAGKEFSKAACKNQMKNVKTLNPVTATKDSEIETTVKLN